MFWSEARLLKLAKSRVIPDAKNGFLVATHGVEPNVEVVSTNAREVMPFRLSVDVPRAAIVLIISVVAYLL